VELVKHNSVFTRFGICIAVMGALLAPFAAFNLTTGIAGAAEQQELQAVPSYANPLTGEVEDAGQNFELGQEMSENLIMQTPATLLVDSEGSIFITFRVGLVEESQDLVIQLLNADGQAVETLPYSIVENHEHDNTRDIRIMVPDKNPILRVSLVSIPMGREVVCFVNFAPEGEIVAVPIPAAESELDDDAIAIFEHSADDEIAGIAEEDRGQVLMFLAIAAGILAVMGIAGAVMFLRKKKTTDAANNTEANNSS